MSRSLKPGFPTSRSASLQRLVCAAAGISALALAFACSTTSEPTRIRWSKSGASEQQLRQDRADCMEAPDVAETAQIRRAEATAAKVGWARFEACMRERGWRATSTRTPPPASEGGEAKGSQ